MSNRISKFTNTIKQLGEIQVTELDFMELLNKDIKDLEISRSLRRLGNIRVTEWDFKNVLPAVSKLAHQEVDLVDFFRRTASYKVVDWDFRNALNPEPKPPPPPQRPGPAEIQTIILRLKNFLEYVVVNLIDDPAHAQIKVREIAPAVLRFRLVLVKRDVAMLIGMQGHTASAIRSVLKAAAGMHGVNALLEILSHEDEAALPGD